jgi:putative transposase
VSRPLRLEYPGAVWHVTSRGNERRRVFQDEADRERFLSILGRTVGLFRWKLHAYVLMGNHYHLLVETPEPTLSRGMRQVNGLYTQAFNRRHRRAGHLFQGRFKAILVEKESHLLELCRYVVLNPVRAGMSKKAAVWGWSSYRATAALKLAPEWLETDWTLKQFGRRRSEAVQKYRQFVADGKKAGYEPWKQVQGQIYLGSDEFLAEMERRAKRSPARGVPRQQRQPRPADAKELLKRSLRALGLRREDLLSRTRLLAAERKAVASAMRKHALLPFRQIGELLGVGEAHASVLAAAAEADPGRAGILSRRIEKFLLADEG